MRSASQLSGRGPTGVGVAPYLHINQKSDYDLMMMIYDRQALATENPDHTPVRVYSVCHSSSCIVMVKKWTEPNFKTNMARS